MTTSSSLEELLLVEMSRRNTDLIAGLVLQKGELFDELMDVFLRNEEPVSRRAAWVADTVSEIEPELLIPFLPRIINSLRIFSHDGLKRHALRMISRSQFPDSVKGELICICFDWILSPAEAVAAKVYCMNILYSLSLAEPDLKKELADSIEWRMHEESPGFRAHGTKVLAKLYRDLR
ncbi:MAG: hypothetical protein WCO93_03475 [bacterium]